MKTFIRGFGYAFQGIWYAIIHERNMRFHISLFGYMMFFLLRYDFFEISKVEFAVLLMMSALVMAGELINTGIEKAADAATLEKNPYVKISKDSAAGGVLIAAIFSIAVGIIIMFQPEAFKKLFAYYTANPLYIIILIATLVPDAIFIFVGPLKIKTLFRGKKND